MNFIGCDPASIYEYLERKYREVNDTLKYTQIALARLEGKKETLQDRLLEISLEMDEVRSANK